MLRYLQFEWQTFPPNVDSVSSVTTTLQTAMLCGADYLEHMLSGPAGSDNSADDDVADDVRNSTSNELLSYFRSE